MADDSMEISSEHGHNVGDDIDIDIDLTTGQADEDYVLQDALSSADYGNDFLPQLSPEMHHDDVMVDDDNASYQMEDADLIHDEAEEIIETEVAMADPFQALNADDGNTLAYTEEHDIGLYFNQQDGHDETLVGDNLQDSENISRHEDIVPASEDMVRHDETLPTDESTFQEVEGVEKGEAHHESQDSPPPGRSPAAAPEEPRSPTSISGIGSSAVTHESNNAIPEPHHNSPHEDSVKSDEPSSVERTYDLSNAYAMKVVYQSVEYALFSTSESDDPDSFFLSDIAIMEKPMGDLFKAIREIIHDDLAEEDELCLSIEDLGLETEEASYIQDITLARILTLYESLLRNDGVDSARPLYLVLGTKVNFRSRFLNLHQGASQGKGLSELVVWDKNSESLDDLEDGDEATNDIESSLLNHETAQDADAEAKQGIEDENKENGPVEEVSVELHEEEQQTKREEEREERAEGVHEEEHEEASHEATQPEKNEPAPVPKDPALAAAEHTRESDVANVKIDSQGGSPQQPTTPDTDPTKPLTSTEADAVNDEDNEEDDLIDYSEEDIQNPAEERRTSVVADENRTDTEYQAKEEELRRRSISRQAEERLLEQSLDQAYENTNDSNHHEEYFEGNETGYDDYSTVFHGNQSDSYEFVENAGETSLNDQNDGFDGHENFENDEVTYEHNPEIGAEGYDDVSEENRYQTFEDFGDEGTGLQGLPAYAEETASHEASDFVEVNGQETVHEHPAPSTASSLGAAETTESSVTLGAEDMGYEDNLDEEISNELKELENATTPTNGSNLEQKDEIDYEDDEDEEDEELPSLPGPEVATATKELPNANGKRPIAEVESVVSTPSKDAKRPRS